MNKLQGQIHACICDQTEYLESLDLSSNKLNGQFPSNFGNCSSLKVLNVANNHFRTDTGGTRKIEETSGIAHQRKQDTWAYSIVPAKLKDIWKFWI